MTPQRDIESVLDRWFDEGPAQMPDRLFDEVFDRIDHVPQRRLARIQTRLFVMSSNLKFASAAAVVLAVAGATVLVLGRPPGTGVTPSTTPAPTAPATVAPAALLPGALQHLWIGATRSVAGINPAPDSALMTLSRSSLQFDGGGAGKTALFSKAEAIGRDQIAFRIITPGAGCSAGDLGTYRYSLSAGGGYLTFTKLTETCPGRADAVSGSWQRSACPDAQYVCLGPLEAGDHLSVQFNPRVPLKSWRYEYGRFGYTVPAGWENGEESRSLYTISRQGLGEDAAIFLLSEQVAHAQAADCAENVPASGVGRTPGALVAWIRSLPSLVTTAPVTTTVGGLNGLMVDVSVKPSWKQTCPGSEGIPDVKVFADPNREESHDLDVRAGIPKRLILLDLGDGRTLVIQLTAKDKATYDALVPDAMTIIQTFRFNP
jgi:hypothetical protein